MRGTRFTSRVVHGLPVHKREGDNRLFCKQCEVPLDMKKGGCTACNELRKKWREARIQHYADSRHPQTLAQMLVELEDSHDSTPEFSIEEEWLG
jgi:hypothetical protein